MPTPDVLPRRVTRGCGAASPGQPPTPDVYYPGSVYWIILSRVYKATIGAETNDLAQLYTQNCRTQIWPLDK